MIRKTNGIQLDPVLKTKTVGKNEEGRNLYKCKVCIRIINAKECILCWDINKKGTRNKFINRSACRIENIGREEIKKEE